MNGKKIIYNIRKNYESITKVRLFLSYCYYYFMNSSKKSIGTQNLMGPVECETNLTSFLSHSDYFIG